MKYIKQLKQIHRGLTARVKNPKHNRAHIYRDLQHNSRVLNFNIFYEWAIKNGYRPGLTIDRKDNTRGYWFDNCRWVTAREQALNRSTTSRFPGCYPVMGASTFKVQLTHKGRPYYIGTVPDQELGHLIYQIVVEYLDTVGG